MHELLHRKRDPLKRAIFNHDYAHQQGIRCHQSKVVLYSGNLGPDTTVCELFQYHGTVAECVIQPSNDDEEGGDTGEVCTGYHAC